MNTFICPKTTQVTQHTVRRNTDYVQPSNRRTWPIRKARKCNTRSWQKRAKSNTQLNSCRVCRSIPGWRKVEDWGKRWCSTTVDFFQWVVYRSTDPFPRAVRSSPALAPDTACLTTVLRRRRRIPRKNRRALPAHRTTQLYSLSCIASAKEV